MTIRLPLIAAATAALLAGCMVGPDYKRPDTGLPQVYTAPATPVPQTETVDAEWWRSFNDPQLNTLVERALRDSSDIRIAMARIEQSTAVLDAANATMLPDFDLNGSATRNRISTLTATPLPSTVSPVRSDFRLAGTLMSYELDFWGRARRARESAIALYRNSLYARDTVRLTLAASITQDYLTLRSLDTQLDAARANLKNREDALAISQRRYKAGSVSRLDVEQAQSSLAALQAQVASLVQQQASVQNDLALLTGTPDLQIEAGRGLAALPNPPLPPTGLPSALLDARPDVRQSEASLASFTAQIGVAKAAFYPSISLSGFFGGESADLADLFKGGARIWSTGAALSLPIFDGGTRQAQLEQAQGKANEALEQYRKTAQTAYREVRDALVGVRQSAEIERAREVQRKSAEQAERIAKARYDAGSAAFTELLDAQRSRNDADIAFCQARQARLSAMVSLYKALGGGWKEEGAKS